MDKPKRKQIRLSYYDYNSVGEYFVTICTHEKRRILSDIVVGAIHESPAAEVRLTPAGEIVRKVIEILPQKYTNLQIDHFVIMPNHVHLLVQITGERAIHESPAMRAFHSDQHTSNRLMRQTAGGFCILCICFLLQFPCQKRFIKYRMKCRKEEPP